MKKVTKEIKLDDIDRKILKLYNTTTKSASEIALEVGFTGNHGWFNGKVCRLRSLGLLRDSMERRNAMNKDIKKNSGIIVPGAVPGHLRSPLKGTTPFDPVITSVNKGMVDMNKVIDYAANVGERKLIVPRIPKLKTSEKLVTRPNKESAVLVLSDLHIGSVTKSRSKDNIHEMFTNLLNNIITVKSYLLGYNIEELYIFILGDILTGENEEENQRASFPRCR